MCLYIHFYENEIDDTKVIQYFIMCVILLCIKLTSFVERMFYAFSFSHNAAVPIAIKKNKYFISFNTYTIFSWGSDNSNKIERNYKNYSCLKNKINIVLMEF